MVLVVGATGRVGGRIARALVERGEDVRVLARQPEKLADLGLVKAEVVGGDLLDPSSLRGAIEGVDAVVTTANGGGLPPAARVVDREGMFNLIAAAGRAGVRRFVFVSANSAGPDSPVDFFRWKWEAEKRLRASGLEYTILRPTHLIDTWIEVLSDGVRKGSVMLFGRASNPISFVAGEDLARLAVDAIGSPDAANQVFEVGGDRAVSLDALVERMEQVSGRRIGRQHVPLWMMVALRPVVGLVQPVLARRIGFAILIETKDQVSRDRRVWEVFPGPRTDVAEFVTEWVRREVEAAPARVDQPS